MIEDESLGLGKPKIYTEVEETPLTIYYIPVMNEESMNEAKQSTKCVTRLAHNASLACWD